MAQGGGIRDPTVPAYVPANRPRYHQRSLVAQGTDSIGGSDAFPRQSTSHIRNGQFPVRSAKKINPPQRGPVLIIMGKLPLPGRCKTRLRPRLGLRGAARLQHSLLRDRIRAALRTGFPVELHFDGPRGHPLLLTARRKGLCLRRQAHADLGTRMLRALHGRPAVIIGTDCPALDIFRLKQALAAVHAGKNLCIPAGDGGYVLIGLSRHHPRSFRCIDWGSDSVLRQSRRQHRQGHLLVEEWSPLRDLDTPRDFWRERRSGRLPAFGYAPL